MNPGTAQDRRLPDALRPGYALPDELTFTQRVRLTLEYATRLRFKDSAGQDAGHWGEALIRDECMVLADMAAFPSERLYQQFQREAPAVTSSRLLEFLWHLALRADHWVKHLHGHHTEAAQEVLRSLEREIALRLAEPLRASIRIQHPSAARIRAYPWHAVWGMASAEEAPPPSLSRQGLRTHVLLAFQSIRLLKEQAQRVLDRASRSGQHDPASGLLLAFLALLEKAQGRLNRFPERLVSFYYEDILGMGPREAEREQVYLALVPEPLAPSEIRLEAGTRFLAGLDADGQDVVFASDDAFRLTDVQVGALCTLRLEHSAHNSPECDLGFSTRAKAERLPLVPPEAANQAQPPWWPLFGGQAKGSASNAQDGRLGWALSSPLLDLREGTREIRLRLHLAHPAGGDPTLEALLRTPLPSRDGAWLGQVFERYAWVEGKSSPACAEMGQAAWTRAPLASGDQHLRYLVARVLHAEHDPWLRSSRMGLLLAAWLVSIDDLLDADLAALRLACGWEGAPAEVDDPLSLFFGDRPLERELVFDRVFRGVWRVQLSGPTGWFTPGEVFVRRSNDVIPTGPHGGSLEVRLCLGPEHPAVGPCLPDVHGEGWPREPMIQFELQTQTRMFNHGLLRELILEDVGIEVAVSGAREVVVHNQLGRLDPGRPFQPFGPMPVRGDYLVLGHAELARKPLRSLRVNVWWTGLPGVGGGLPEHYVAYPGCWDHDQFQVQLSLLRDGHWKRGQGPAMSLFQTATVGRSVMPHHALTFDASDLARHHKASSYGGDLAFDYDRRRRNGFFRLELTSPAEAFGHALFPRLLTDVLTSNARLKRHDPLPQTPYTPVIDHLTVDYRAARVMRLIPKTQGASRTDADRFFHLHAFGEEEIRPVGTRRRWPLLPRIDHDGNLFIGLQGREPRGALSLFFHLREEVAVRSWHESRPQPRWSVWTHQGWRWLEPEEVMGDETQGFLRSGIVTLDLPEALALGCPRLPQGFWWLRLGVDDGEEGFAGLQGVHAQVLLASRVTPRLAEDDGQPLAPGAVTQTLLPVSGLERVIQLGQSFGVRPRETPEQLRIRTCERLSHKGRASLPWDIERLVLLAFPDVFKTACFPHHRTPTAQEIQGGQWSLDKLQKAPGHALVAVVPAPRRGELFHGTQAPTLDVGALERIERYLAARSTGARIHVRNASYEQVQIRCCVRLVKGSHPGTCLRALNEAVVRYLSPWHEEGYGPVFGWCVRAEDLEVHLRNLPYVDAVGQISLLHIVHQDDGRYVLTDTARGEGAGWHEAVVRPHAPWSLMLPTPRHLFELIEDPDAVQPRPTGVDRLEVGKTFILSRSRHDQ